MKKFRFARTAGAVVALMAAAPVSASDNNNPFLPWRPPESVNDFGGTGLIQTPIARAAEDGQAYAGFTYVWPYSRYFITVQGLPWLEATLRYTSVANRYYGPEDFSGLQSYKDRGIDVKLRLVEGDATWPNIAVGLRDIAGTGLFGSEYLVADQSFGDFDVSVGMGWGNMGTRNHFGNPLGLFSKKFKQRPDGYTSGGGTLSTDFFRGPVAMFGGVSWQTPLEGLRLKLEYDPNDYQHEPLDNDLKQSIPVNVGLDYKPWDWLQVGAAFERGERLMLRFATTTNFHKAKGPGKIDAPPPPLIPSTPVAAAPPPQSAASAAGGDVRAGLGRQAALDGVSLQHFTRMAGEIHITVSGTPVRDGTVVAYDLARRAAELAPDFKGRIQVTRVEYNLPWMVTSFEADSLRTGSGLRAVTDAASPVTPVVTGEPPTEDVRKELASQLQKQGFFLTAVDYKSPRATLFLTNGRYRQVPKAIGRAARTAAAVLPPEYQELQIIFMDNGMEMLSATLYRADLERALSPYGGSIEEAWMRTRIDRPEAKAEEASHPEDVSYPGFGWNIRPAFRQTLGRPESFILYQAWVRLNGTVVITPGLNVAGGLGINVSNNFDKMRIPSDSQLPHVRSDIKNYLQEGTTALTYLQADYTKRVATDTYARVYGGYLEEMFGGVGGEVLYKPFGREWAIGLDVAWAKQRDYDQWFKFRPYDVVTGHLTGYYHYEPIGVDARLKVGRYLAGDEGATFELSRTFDSGITVGAFATFTNVSAKQFGEGRFDKGIYFIFPLDNLYVKSTRGSLGWLWRPLTRDGGQTLNNRRPLIGQVGTADGAALRRDWNLLMD
ncbi:YjbH domain-containing protein [Niveispirillum sp.]|uniref:YjbH domain-containing protein n=1 Tax=Niveispirillum sp. TaxID=1917217 RepID=UPI001B4184A5|nr:YjbH domain-containing protein [Niveispirillum sp.]MBP7334413.1 YjbH domain-containing protein [Niveispirillum sp.]